MCVSRSPDPHPCRPHPTLFLSGPRLHPTLAAALTAVALSAATPTVSTGNGHGVGPIVNPGAPQQCTRLEFWYQGIKQLPYRGDFSRWHDLVHALVRHAVKRYGLAEVQSWQFEVWNELWGLSWPVDYMALFNASSRAIKSVDPSLRVGGPATAVLAHVKDFSDLCEAAGIAKDFVSTHHYPTDSCPKGSAWDPDCFARDVLRVRRTVPRSLPFLLTEYNVGCCLGYAGHDKATAAAFIFRSVRDLNEELDVYSYWTFTDVFEEGGMPRIEFKDVYGAMSVHGVPKPAWRAFQLLHTHAGDRRLPVAISNQTHTHPAETHAVLAASSSSSSSSLSSPPPTTTTTTPPPPPPPPLWAVAVPCNRSDATQLRWRYEGGALEWQPGPAADDDEQRAGKALCLDSVGGDAALQLRPCVYLQPSQGFANAGGGRFEQRGKCLDVFLPDVPAYRRMDLYACNGGTNQQFELASASAGPGTALQQLVSKSHACVAVRVTPAGPPPPPPPPPLLPKPYVAAFATVNSTDVARRRMDDVPAFFGSLCIFLSFWNDPEATAGLLASRLVTVSVRHAATSATPTTATIHVIDDAHVNPSAEWIAQGSPAQPNASQLAALMAASKVVTAAATPRRVNDTCTAVDVLLAENSAVVVSFAS